MSLPDADQLVASAVHYLIQGEEFEAATVLLMCDISVSVRFGKILVKMSGPRAAYDILSDSDNPVSLEVNAAFNAVHEDYNYYTVRAQFLDDLDPNWRAKLLEIARGRGVHNQGVEIPHREIVLWGNLRFRSRSEVRIAQALDANRVLYLPNCLARLGLGDQRATREADFLICYKGKWGILEVDGPYHTRAAVDHERDRLFQQHGIRNTQRFTAEDCYSDAPGVVKRFLTLLEQNG